MKKISIFIIAFSIAIAFGNQSIAKTNSNIEVDQISVPSLTIVNPQIIALILDELMIPEENPSQIQVIDINSNGFGEKDILRVFYQVEDSLKLSDVYFLVGISKKLQAVLHRYEFKVNVRLDAANMDQLSYEAHSDPYYAILGALAEGLNRNYKDYLPIKIYFKRDVDGLTMEFWGFDKKEMHFTPTSLKGGRDLLFITIEKSDTLFISK
ncbi:hypothetical protein JW960_05445 [candidate division KSB1 bacterium]|nr:hypothetical protein [candidate division KSB1 bacterium]